MDQIAIHTITTYPPANLNRDEDGRPKAAIDGGTERLRVSSQARKRPWRLAAYFLQSTVANCTDACS